MLTNLLSLLVLAIACFALVAAGADPIVTTADVSAGSGTCDASSGVCLGGGSTVPTTQAEVPKGANAEGRPLEAPVDCVDRYPDCVGYAQQGECEKNPGWMIVFCALSCNACHLRDPAVRCDRSRLAMDPNPVFAPNEMQTMFDDMVPRFGSKYNITVHSTSPFVVTIEDFLSGVEADAIINAVNKWERSTDTGSANSYGEVGRVLSKSRTSSNAWCHRECEKNPYVKIVTQRIEEFTRVPSQNYESFQVLQYLPSQFYRVHHDNGASERIQPAGPRILTFFLYLSDVEEGGETRFPSLNITVHPKRGRALLWPSTLTDRPDTTDSRTMHEARPVIKGVKYAANAWIHLYNFRVPNLWGCTGSFDIK